MGSLFAISPLDGNGLDRVSFLLAISGTVQIFTVNARYYLLYH